MVLMQVFYGDKLQMHYGTKPGHFETSNHSLSHKRGSEQSERVSERANGRTSGPVLTSVYFSIFDHGARVVCGLEERKERWFSTMLEVLTVPNSVELY